MLMRFCPKPSPRIGACPSDNSFSSRPTAFDSPRSPLRQWSALCVLETSIYQIKESIPLLVALIFCWYVQECQREHR